MSDETIEELLKRKITTKVMIIAGGALIAVSGTIIAGAVYLGTLIPDRFDNYDGPNAHPPDVGRNIGEFRQLIMPDDCNIDNIVDAGSGIGYASGIAKRYEYITCKDGEGGLKMYSVELGDSEWRLTHVRPESAFDNISLD